MSSTSVASSSFFGFSLSSSSVDSSSSSGSSMPCGNKDVSLSSSVVTIAENDDHNSNNHLSQQQNNADYKTKNALAKMKGSLAALLSFLSHHGLSQASVKELENALYNAQYLTLMKRLEEYLLILCLDTANPSPSLSVEESEAAIFLLLSAWQALCNHVNLLHRQAHRDFTRLQGQPRRWRSAAPYQHQQQSGDAGTNTTGMQFPMSHKEVLRTSLIRLTILAEHSCDCQKGYLLAQRQWKRKVPYS